MIDRRYGDALRTLRRRFPAVTMTLAPVVRPSRKGKALRLA